MLRANALLMVALLVLSLFVGYGVYWLLAKYAPVYTATARLQVQTPMLLDATSPNGVVNRGVEVPLEIRLETQRQKLQLSTLWEKMLQNADDPVRAKTAWARDFVIKDSNGAPVFDMANAILDLRKRLSVMQYKGSEIVDVNISTREKADAVIILDELVRNHIQSEQGGSSQAQKDERDYWQLRQTRLNTQIANYKAQIKNLQDSLGYTTNGQGGRGDALHQEVSRLVDARIEAQSKLEDAKASLASIQAMMDAGEVPPIVKEYIDNDPTLARLRATRDELDTNIAVMKQEKGEKFPGLKSMQTQMDIVKAKIDDRESELRTNRLSMIKQSAQAAVDGAQSTLKAIDAQYANTTGELSRYTKDLGALNSNNDIVKLYEGRLQAVQDKLDMIDQNGSRNDQAMSTIKKIGVEEPRGMSSPQLPIVMVLSGIAGLGIGLLTAFLRELTDTSIRSPRDINRVGQMNLLGMIPHEDDDPQAAGSELSLVISQAPHSVIAEQFRHVRTRLQHAASLDTTRSLLVTSPGPGDGKTTVACNIAAGLALNGRKILLVDANFRRPQVHAVFGLSNDVGFGSVLGQQASVETAVRKSNVPNLDVLTTGPRPANPTELLESALLTEFIDRALEEYDHVVFDSGPILLVSETVALAPRVDGVITVVKARANSRGLLQRMRDALRQLKAEHIGVVLNGVRTQGGGYYGRNIKTYYTYQSAGN
ncbi:MAG: polysaccharide biosynthesis tyrosine autokinase [Tepidisphaeraceae bacterium]